MEEIYSNYSNVGTKKTDLLEYVPVFGTVKVGVEAVQAFRNGNWGKGLAKTLFFGVLVIGDLCLIVGVTVILIKAAIKEVPLVIKKTGPMIAKGVYDLGFVGRIIGRN